MSGQLSIVKKPTTKCFVIQDQQIYMTILNQPIFISTYMLSTKKDFSSSLFGLLFEWLTELIMLVRYMFMDQITDSTYCFNLYQSC
jgi:hypothetical protein